MTRPDDDPRADQPDDDRHLGERLAAARRAVGLEVDQVAERLGVRRSTVEAWEAGDGSPRGHRVSKLAGMTGTSVAWLLSGLGDGPSAGPADDPAAELVALRSDLAAVRERLDDVVNALAVLDRRLAARTTPHV